LCPDYGAAKEIIGGVISVDTLNPFARNRQAALIDGEPRLHIEYAVTDPITGQLRYNWDGTDGKFKPNPSLGRVDRLGERVPVSVLGGHRSTLAILS
jgi:hypothetical protein